MKNALALNFGYPQKMCTFTKVWQTIPWYWSFFCLVWREEVEITLGDIKLSLVFPLLLQWNIDRKMAPKETSKTNKTDL